MINAYDFDGTIYDGDSSLDFYFFCLRKKPSIILFLPIQIFGILLYVLKIKNKDYMKEKIFHFLKKIANPDKYVTEFWQKKYQKIKPWYLKQKQKSDVIISASPEFLLKPLEKKLKISKVIATKVNKNTGKFESPNCHDYEKIKRYEEIYPNKKIKAFYSDSIKADRAMLEYASKAYLVKKDNVEEIDIKNYQEPPKQSYPLILALDLFIFLSFLSIIPTIMYFFKIGIQKIYFPLALLIIVIFNFFFTKKDYKRTIIASLLAYLFIFISLIICLIMIDTSVDGNSYRKITSGLMREGWNPVLESAKSFNNKAGILPSQLSVFGNKSQWFWMDVYPKGLATFGACIALFTGYIETGKCYTILTMLILFFFAYLVLKKYFKTIPNIILSLIIALNPVSLCQLRTFYVDAALSNYLLIALASTILYFRDYKKLYLFIICTCIINIFSIKFNGMLYIAIICLLMWGMQLLQDKKNKNYQKSKTIFLLYALAVIVAFIVNFSPFVTNITRYHELLPGITGNSTKATGNVTVSTKNLNTIQLFYVNIFSKVGDYWQQKSLPLKIPFTFVKAEIGNYGVHAGQFGTFGMMFSGIFIIITILSLYLIIKNRQTLFKDKESRRILVFLLAIYISSVLSPIGYGGLRYVGHFYIIVPYTIALSMYFINKSKKKETLLKITNLFLIILVVINLLPYLYIYHTNVETYRQDVSQLYALSNSNKKITIALSTDSSHGLLLNLRDYNIKWGTYKFVPKEELPNNVQYTLCFQIRYIEE